MTLPEKLVPLRNRIRVFLKSLDTQKASVKIEA
jgi:hypothetical protein